MKLIIATLTAATVFASTASAMVSPEIVDNAAAAQGALGFVTTGEVSQIAIEDYVTDPRAAALTVSDTVAVTSFENTTAPQGSSIYR